MIQTSLPSNSAFLASNSACVRMPLPTSPCSFSSVAMTSSALAPAAAAAPAAGVGADDVVATLEKLHGLVGKGILSQAEFDAKKAELLGKLS